LIDFKIENKTARITLNRPEKRNAMNDQLIRELRSALASAASHDSVAVTLLAAAGPDFCAGMDIAVLERTAGSSALELLDSARSLGALYAAIRKHPHPVVGAVRGRALGGGCGMATACDIVFAAETAQFGYPEVGLGFAPAIVMSLLRHSLGEKRAFELLVSQARRRPRSPRNRPGDPRLSRRTIRILRRTIRRRAGRKIGLRPHADQETLAPHR